MLPNIEIKFLSPKDMENAKDMDWRYEHVNEGNLGFADKKKNRVFVRSGLDSEVTKYLIDHEISHLFEMKGTDEDEHGIRHKWFDSVKDQKEAQKTPDPDNVFHDPQGNVISEYDYNNLHGLDYQGNVSGSSKNWWESSWEQLAPLVTYALTNLAGSAVGNLFGGGSAVAGAAGSGGALPSGAGISMGAGSVGSGIGGEVLGGALSSGAAPAIGTSTPSIIGNPSDFFGALGNLFGGSSKGAVTVPQDSLQLPDMGGSATPENYTGNFGAGWPEMGGNYGMEGAQTSTGVGEMGGLSKMPIQPGLGQAGIDLQGKTGFSNMFQGAQGGQGMGQQVDPIGYNYSNGGQLSF